MKFLPFFIFLGLLSSCVSDRQLGDKEFELNNYKKALEYYDLEISAGSKDPRVYTQAARASVQMGSFGTAERYYGKAISNGAKTEVIRELAKFYVRTSNYGSAIRVYKYLLNIEKNKQPIYNNLGTAYIYAGSPFDAESYLLIAQQLEPKDPFPYLNLGLLYDQNLKKWPKAIGFYKCFVSLAPKHESTPGVKQRLVEIGAKVSTEEVIDCTVPYTETARSVSLKELRTKMLDLETDSAPDTDTDLDKTESKSKGKEIEIVNLKSPLVVGFEKTSRQLKPASDFYLKFDFESAVKEFEKLPLSVFDADASLAFGDSLSRLFRFSEATTWLQLSDKIQSTPKTVELLINAFNNLGKQSEMKFWCEKYKGRPVYETALKNCPISPNEKIEKSLPKKEKDTLEKTEEKRREPSSK